LFKQGLVSETEELLKRGLAENRTTMQALGYRQVVEHLRGIRSLDETIELVKIRTRQFAKRQMTWFKKYGPSNWINLAFKIRLNPARAKSSGVGAARIPIASKRRRNDDEICNCSSSLNDF